MYKLKIALLFLLCFCFFSVKAEDIKYKKVKHLNLIDVIDLALKNNPKVKQAWLDVDVSNYSYKIEKSNYFPDINVEISYSKNKNEYNNTTTKSEDLTPGITLSYLLFDFGGRESSVAMLKHKLQETKFETNNYVQNFIYDVVDAYYKVFSSIANEKASKEAENSSYEAFKAAKVRYDIGLAPLTDKLQAETSYMQKKLVREQAENNVKIKKAELNYLLNLSPTNDLNLSAPYLTIPEKDFDENIENLFMLAVNNRADLKAYYENKASKKSEIYNARAERFPAISFRASYQNVNDLEKNSRNDRDLYNIGLTASMPFFTGGSITNNVAKKKTELSVINQQINDLEKNIELEVWEAYQNFITAKKTYLTSETLLKSATETEKTMLGRYKNGKSSILDLLNAQSDLATAKYEFISAQHNWFISKANLLKTLGQIGVEELSSLNSATNKIDNNFNGKENAIN